MKYINTLDDKFARLADDDKQRALVLARLQNRRTWFLIGGFFVVADVGIMGLLGHAMWAFSPFAVMCFVVAFKYESDIRTLKMVERMQQTSKSHAA
jgi:hypothetical protein